MKLTIDPNSLTFQDIEDMEEATGRPIGEFLAKFQGRDGKDISLAEFPAKMLTAMVWVFGRREEPGLTLEGARAMRLAELEMNNPPAEAGGATKGSGGSRSSRGSTGSRRRISGI